MDLTEYYGVNACIEKAFWSVRFGRNGKIVTDVG